MMDNINPVYQYWMSVKDDKEFYSGERVGLFDIVCKSGKIKFYGYGTFLGMKARAVNSFASGYFLNRIDDGEQCAMLDNGDHIYSSQAFFISEKDTDMLLCLSKDIKYVQLQYKDVEKDELRSTD